MEFLYKVRYRLRTEGVFEKIKRDKKEEEIVADEDEAEAELPAGDETIMQTEEKEVDPSDEREEKEPPGSVPPTGRPIDLWLVSRALKAISALISRARAPPWLVSDQAE